MELPEALRRTLPREAQRAYREAYREARDAGADEDSARVAAQEAVEDEFQLEHGAWVREAAEGRHVDYGEAAIAAIARRAGFPCTTAQLVAGAGDPEIEIAPGQPMRLADALAAVEGYYWQDAAQLLEAVHAAWPEVRKRWDAAHAPVPARGA